MNSHTDTTAKLTSKGLRIWLEGAKLSAHGFNSLVPYSVIYDVQHRYILIAVDASASKKVCKSRPIIDLVNKKIATVFNAGERLRADFAHNSITITGEHNE